MSDPAPATERSGLPGRLTVAGWAAYLASSWTWCIGMFLPVLLVRDFGPWAFVVFAVPNILGAAAMGWIIRSPAASADIARRHQPAIQCFSLVTVAFQVFFACWLLRKFDGPPNWIIPAYALIPLIAILDLWRRRSTPGLSRVALVWAASAIALLIWLISGRAAIWSRPPQLPPQDLLWLTPVCMFGFGLCPYLDATFHRARQSTPGAAGPAAFTIGFALLFTPMILFTLFYAAWLGPQMAGVIETDWAGALVIAHILIQLLLTITLHLRDATASTTTRAAGMLILAVLLALGASLLAAAWPPARGPLPLGWEETAYRLFMAFYGLVFPAYVWLCMIPTRDGHTGPTRRKRNTWLFAVALAAPMYWMGFIERQTWWLGPGLAVVLLARAFLPRNSAPQTTPPAPARRL